MPSSSSNVTNAWIACGNVRISPARFVSSFLMLSVMAALSFSSALISSGSPTASPCFFIVVFQ
jgi:hypothetical protein